MNEEKDLNYFMNLNYDVVLRKKGDDYYLFIPELSVIAYGKELDEAYKKLNIAKEEFFRNIIDLKLQDTVNEPVGIKIRKKHYHEIFQYLMKVLVTFLLFVVIFIIIFLPVLSSFEKFVSNTISSVPEKILSKTAAKIEYKLTNMTEKEKEETRLRIKGMVSALKPFADEIRILFEDEKKTTRKSVDREGKAEKK
jgi:hypothetical protein